MTIERKDNSGMGEPNRLRSGVVNRTPAGTRRLAAFSIHVALLVLALHPLFFIIFRLMIFDTVPRDDYAPQLLWWVGATGGARLGSLYEYRVLSVLAAAPFYYVLPTIDLTNLPGSVSLDYARATAALAAVSFLAIVASAVLSFRLAVDRFGVGRPEGMIAASFILVAQLHAAPFGVDPLAIFVVLLALYFIHRIAVFAAIMIGSVVLNEKIIIVFAIWLWIRWLLRSGQMLRRQLIAATVAVPCYIGMVLFLRLPGHGEQLDPFVYLPTLVQNVVASVTPRGLLFNVLPCLLLVGAVARSWHTLGSRRDGIYAPHDLLLVPGLAVVTLMLTQYYQVGRVVAHGAPIFIWPIVQHYASQVRGRD